MSRSKAISKQQMWALLKLCERIVDNREQLNMTKEDALALQLRFACESKEMRDNIKAKVAVSTDEKEMLFFYMRTLGHIRLHGKANIDEVHEALARRKQLNYPFGKPEKVRKEFIYVIDECIRCLIQCPELDQILKLRENGQACASAREGMYRATIMLPLAERMSHYLPLDITDDQRASFIEYVCGKATEIPPFVLSHKHRSQIGLIKGLVSIILPQTLKKIAKVDYGPSKIGNGEYSRPYEGNENPQENAIIQERFEAIVKTYMSFTHAGLSRMQATRLYCLLHGSATKEARELSMPLQNTRSGRLFKKCFSVEITESTVGSITQSLKNDEAILNYTRIFVASEIEYFLTNIKGDSQNFASMFASFYSDTGTPYNEGTFPQGTKVLWDKGTNGETVELLRRLCKAPETIQIIPDGTPQKLWKRSLITLSTRIPLSLPS